MPWRNCPDAMRIYNERPGPVEGRRCQGRIPNKVMLELWSERWRGCGFIQAEGPGWRRTLILLAISIQKKGRCKEWSMKFSISGHSVHGQGTVMRETLFQPGGIDNRTGGLRGGCWSLLGVASCGGLNWCFCYWCVSISRSGIRHQSFVGAEVRISCEPYKQCCFYFIFLVCDGVGSKAFKGGKERDQEPVRLRSEQGAWAGKEVRTRDQQALWKMWSFVCVSLSPVREAQSYYENSF